MGTFFFFKKREGKAKSEKNMPETGLSHEGRALVDTLYRWRNVFCAGFCVYLLLQGGMIMVFSDSRSLLTLTTALIPTYVFVMSMIFLFPLLLIFSNVRIFTCDNFAIFLLILAAVLYTALGIASLEHANVNYFELYLPPMALVFVVGTYYTCMAFMKPPFSGESGEWSREQAFMEAESENE